MTKLKKLPLQNKHNNVIFHESFLKIEKKEEPDYPSSPKALLHHLLSSGESETLRAEM